MPGDLPEDPGGEAGPSAVQAQRCSTGSWQILAGRWRICRRHGPDARTHPDAQHGAKTAVTPTPAPAIPDRQPWVMPRAEIEAGDRDGRLGGAYRPITVARYIQEATAFLIAEDAVNLPGVQLLLEPIRDYPSGALTSQIIGYMGHIPEAQARGIRRPGLPAKRPGRADRAGGAFEDGAPRPPGPPDHRGGRQRPPCAHCGRARAG